MRRKRGFAWYPVLFVVPALALAFGVQYFMRNNYPDPTTSDVAMVTKPSFYRNEMRGSDTGAGGTSVARNTASWNAEESEEGITGFWKRTKKKILEFAVKPAAEPKSVPEAGTKKIEVVDVTPAEGLRGATKEEKAANARAERAGNAALAGLRKLANSESNVYQAVIEEESDTAPVAAPKVQRLTPATGTEEKSKSQAEDQVSALEGLNTTQGTGSKAACMSIEYRGEGPLAAQVTNPDWDKVLVQFTEVKNDLMVWLSKNRKGFPEKIAQFMENQIMSVRIKRPPVAEEPDLSWRGIGVFTMAGKVPTIHLSPGFVKLVTKQPTRAKFELARLVAQSWAPCEVQRAAAGEAWGPLLSCLQVSETQACTAGSYSESGWAVSTALAAVISPPGCTVPAFKEPAMTACIKKIPTPLMVTANGGALESLWKESRR